MKSKEERLARNRERARIRRERGLNRIDRMRRNLLELQFRNDDLQQKNRRLIQHLARYGITLGGRTSSITMIDHTSSILNGSSLRALPEIFFVNYWLSFNGKR